MSCIGRVSINSYTIRSPGGYKNSEFDGDVLYGSDLDCSGPSCENLNLEFETENPLNAVIEEITGETATIQAEDIHGNEQTATYSNTDIFAQLASLYNGAAERATGGLGGQVSAGGVSFDLLDTFEQQADTNVITTLAVFSGLTASIEQTVSDLINLITNPTQIVTDLYNLAKALWDDYTVIADLITGAVEGIQNSQQRANPFGSSGTVTNVEKEDFEKPSDLASEYNQFAVGWYGGYALGFIVEAVVGSKGVSKLDDIARASSRIESALDAAGRLRAATIGRASGYVKSSAVRIGNDLRQRAPELDTQAVRRSLNDFAVSTQQRVSTKLSELDASTRQTIADNELEGRAVRYLSATKQGGVRLLNRFDSDRLRRSFCGVGGATAALAAGGAPAGANTLASPTVQSSTCGPDVDRGEVPDERFHQLARQNYKGDITDGEFENALSNYRALEGRQSELETLLDTQAVRRALSDRTTTVQQRVATRLADDVDPDARQFAADGGLDEEPLDYQPQDRAVIRNRFSAPYQSNECARVAELGQRRRA